MKIIKLLFLASILSTGLFTSCSNDEDSSPKDNTHVYFMDSSDKKLYKLSIDTGTVSTVKDLAGMYGAGIAYDPEKGQVFFSDYVDEDTPNGKIWRMKLDGTDAVAIVTGLLNPFGIAFDPTEGKVYWGDENGNVSRCNSDGSNLEKGIANIDGGTIRAVAVDSKNKKLYFYDVSNNNLYKANLDGTNPAVILSGYFGYALCVDETNNKIYFDAQTDNEKVSGLYRANLDGSNPTEIDDTRSRIYGIAVDTKNSKVYWTGRDTYEIYKANLNGTVKVTLAKDLNGPRGIFLK
jgi:DNA-binding beta-propeller fold protein YncE